MADLILPKPPKYNKKELEEVQKKLNELEIKYTEGIKEIKDLAA